MNELQDEDSNLKLVKMVNKQQEAGVQRDKWPTLRSKIS